MVKDNLLKKIREIQDGNKNNAELKLLMDVSEAGKTGFECRKSKEGGFLLLNVLEVSPRERKIIIDSNSKQLTVDDFMGAYPFMGYVMESSSEQFKPKDVVLIDAEKMKHSAVDVVVLGSKAVYVSDYCIIGKDNNLRL